MLLFFALFLVLVLFLALVLLVALILLFLLFVCPTKLRCGEGEKNNHD